jgi:hypothetical protein
LNRAARSIKRPTVDIKAILEHSFLQDFHILHDRSKNLIGKPWANPVNWTMREKYFKLLRAKEELFVLHIEIKRVEKWMRNEVTAWDKCITELQTQGDLPLASWAYYELQEFGRLCNSIVHRLKQCRALPGYNGPPLDFSAIELRAFTVNRTMGEIDEAGGDAVPGNIVDNVTGAVDDLEQVLIRMELQG